jgi:hypothetical protein
MRKVLILMIVLTTIRLLLSCCKGGPYNFRWSNLDLTNLDHRTDRPVPLTSTTSTVVNYGIRLHFENERIARNSVFSYNGAYAFDCWAPLINKHSIVDIDVVTRNDFDGGHPSG